MRESQDSAEMHGLPLCYAFFWVLAFFFRQNVRWDQPLAIGVALRLEWRGGGRRCADAGETLIAFMTYARTLMGSDAGGKRHVGANLLPHSSLCGARGACRGVVNPDTGIRPEVWRNWMEEANRLRPTISGWRRRVDQQHRVWGWFRLQAGRTGTQELRFESAQRSATVALVGPTGGGKS